MKKLYIILFVFLFIKIGMSVIDIFVIMPSIVQRFIGKKRTGLIIDGATP